MPKEVSLEVPARRLVQLDGLEQGLEVPGAKALKRKGYMNTTECELGNNGNT